MARKAAAKIDASTSFRALAHAIALRTPSFVYRGDVLGAVVRLECGGFPSAATAISNSGLLLIWMTWARNCVLRGFLLWHRRSAVHTLPFVFSVGIIDRRTRIARFHGRFQVVRYRARGFLSDSAAFSP